MKKEVDEIKFDAEIEKINWQKEWEELKKNKIVIALSTIAVRIYKKVKGANDEENKKGNK